MPLGKSGKEMEKAGHEKEDEQGWDVRQFNVRTMWKEVPNTWECEVLENRPRHFLKTL